MGTYIVNDHTHKGPTAPETADRVQEIRRSLPGQMCEEPVETARLHDGPVYTRHEIRRRVARTLGWRFGFSRGATVEPIEAYAAPISPEALLK